MTGSRYWKVQIVQTNINEPKMGTLSSAPSDIYQILVVAGISVGLLRFIGIFIEIVFSERRGGFKFQVQKAQRDAA